MNLITTPAIGAPNSFLRRVQVDPTIAMDLLREACKVTDAYNHEDDLTVLVEKVQQLAGYVRGFKALHNLTETEQ